MKINRQRLILSVIREKKIRTHEQLVSELTKRGVNVTQATVSRDVKELGIIKMADADGSLYVLPVDLDNPLQKFASEIISITAAGNLVILKTSPGIASAVAAAIDKDKEPLLLGSIAGDDTIFLATAKNTDAATLVAVLNNRFLRYEG